MPHFDRFDTCEAHLCLEHDYHVGDQLFHTSFHDTLDDAVEHAERFPPDADVGWLNAVPAIDLYFNLSEPGDFAWLAAFSPSSIGAKLMG